MGRFFYTLGWILLALLLVDSAMHDPDVQPVVDRQFRRAEARIRSVLDWFGAGEAESHPAPGHLGREASDSPASRWYWSTMLVMALPAIRLSKAAMFWIRTAQAPARSRWVGRATGHES